MKKGKLLVRSGENLDHLIDRESNNISIDFLDLIGIINCLVSYGFNTRL
jgi:hypothetical protein